jgi:hypothetical protein
MSHFDTGHAGFGRRRPSSCAVAASLAASRRTNERLWARAQASEAHSYSRLIGCLRRRYPHGAGFNRGCASRARKPLGKENHGFAVHHRAIPLAHDLKIRSTLAKRRTGLPAIGLQKIGRRGKHVGNAAPEIVIVDAIFHVWQKLRLADLARLGADQIVQEKIAALDDL